MSFAEKFKRKQQQRIGHVSNERSASDEIVHVQNESIHVSNEHEEPDIIGYGADSGISYEEAKNALINLVVSLNRYIFDRRHIARIINAETLCRYFGINPEELRARIAQIRAVN